MAKNGVLMRHFDRQTLYTRLVDEMIPKETASEKSAAEALLPKVTSMLDKLAKHNIIHKNKAGNLKGALQLHVNAL